MAVVFSSDNLGQAVGIKASGATPLITMNVNPRINNLTFMQSAWDKAPAELLAAPLAGPLAPLLAVARYLRGSNYSAANLADDAEEYLARQPATYWADLWYDYFTKPGGSAGRRPSESAVRGIPTNAAEFRRLQATLASTSDIDRKVNVARKLLNARIAQRSLVSSVAGFGLITTISLDFNETPQTNNGQVTASNSLTAGYAEIGGIVFERPPCGSASREDAQYESKHGRHGLERLLEYYYWHRVSNTKGGNDDNVSTMSFTIGKTKISGWVTGFSFEPADVKFRLWAWKIRMLVTPDYFVERIPTKHDGTSFLTR